MDSDERIARGYLEKFNEILAQEGRPVTDFNHLSETEKRAHLAAAARIAVVIKDEAALGPAAESIATVPPLMAINSDTGEVRMVAPEPAAPAVESPFRARRRRQ